MVVGKHAEFCESHDEHAEQEVAPDEEYWPAGQLVQVVAPAADIEPAAQGMQSPLKVT